MTGFLFWNTNGKRLEATIANLVRHYDIDVLMLAECAIPPSELLKTLNASSPIEYHYAPGIGCERVEIYTRFSSRYVMPVLEKDRFTIRRLDAPGLSEILLAVVHLPSKLHLSEVGQFAECSILAQDIRVAEAQVGHHRTVLVGDLNMNPFEDGVIAANGLHAVMSRDVAAKGQRTVQSRRYRFFYNPMWSLMGDISSGPPGTYYYWKSEHKAFFWNTFDQVLIRPELLNTFQPDGLEIVQTDGERSLLSAQNIPDDKLASDHLPIRFKLNLL